MAPTGSLIPATVDQTAIIGADFSSTINLYTDVAQTTAFDLTGYTVTMAIGSLFSLASGSGITITTPSNGTIVAALTAAQTATVVNPGSTGLAVHYSLKLVDGSSVVSFPLSGTITFKVP